MKIYSILHVPEMIFSEEILYTKCNRKCQCYEEIPKYGVQVITITVSAQGLHIDKNIIIIITESKTIVLSKVNG